MILRAIKYETDYFVGNFYLIFYQFQPNLNQTQILITLWLIPNL